MKFSSGLPAQPIVLFSVLIVSAVGALSGS